MTVEEALALAEASDAFPSLVVLAAEVHRLRNELAGRPRRVEIVIHASKLPTTARYSVQIEDADGIVRRIDGSTMTTSLEWIDS